MEGRDVSKDKPAGRGRGRRGGVIWWKGVTCQRTGLQDEEEGGGRGWKGMTCQRTGLQDEEEGGGVGWEGGGRA